MGRVGRIFDPKLKEWRAQKQGAPDDRRAPKVQLYITEKRHQTHGVTLSHFC